MASVRDSVFLDHPAREEPASDGEPAGGLSDEELTALALAADPDQPLAEDAVPMASYLAMVDNLPEWYMAPARARLRGRFARVVVLGLVGSFLAIEAFGLCSTYGQFPFH